MNRDGHIIAGLTFILLFYYIGGNLFEVKTSWLEYAFSFLFGNIMPDVFEPGGRISSWNHRKWLHSLEFTKALIIFVIPALIFLSLKTSKIYIHLIALSGGIIMHNLVDSATRRGWGKFSV
ncbi:MAG: metal-dependent hydrolase [Candidatus Pacearchaeota archaeon]|nr:metal-dependent hydrolase [Candidatus Pacearchaeota archaeon]